MKEFSKTFEVIWADVDPNRHMRHTVYNDYAAHARVALFAEAGMTMDEIARMGIGPILFREETRFLKEVHMSEKITVKCKLSAMRKDGSKWSFRHEIFKENGEKAAVIEIDGAWLDLRKRKIGAPGDEILKLTDHFPRTEDFQYLPDKTTA